MNKKGTWILIGIIAALLVLGLASIACADTGTKGDSEASGNGPLVAKIVMGLGVSMALAGSAIGLSISFSALLGGGSDNFYKYIAVALMPASQGIYAMVVLFTNLSLLDSDPFTAAGKGAIVGFAMGMSAWYQGTVCAAGVRNCLEGRNTMGNALVSGAMPETYAVFGLVMTFIMK